MACLIPPSKRDIMVRVFREEVYRRNGYVEFPHQADWRLASEGYTLTEQPLNPPTKQEKSVWPPDIEQALKRPPRRVQLIMPCTRDDKGAFMVGETGNYARYVWRLAVARAQGTARRLSDMSGFKGGKSKSAGMWMAGFGCLPGATINLLGIEYKSSVNEFAYLVEALISGSKPLFPTYKKFRNDVRNGDMILELNNGCVFQCLSYEQRQTWRGGQVTVYAHNEAYQFPGLEAYTGYAQNLRVEQGFNIFTTTPDRPWVKTLHDLGHGKNPLWHCVCGSTGYVNPFSFDLNAFMTDAPDWKTIEEHCPPELLAAAKGSGLEPGRLMSREKFIIAHLGLIGEFVGRVYQFQEGQLTFTPATDPSIWRPAVRKAWAERAEVLLKLRLDEEAALLA